MKYSWTKHRLQFLRPGGTSRGVLTHKDSWFLMATSPEFEYPAIGECSIIPGLSPDPFNEIEKMLDVICVGLTENGDEPDLSKFPALKFGLEMLNTDIAAKGTKVFRHDKFTSGESGILINGLVWMGDTDFMKSQLDAKISEGFTCIKIKIGSLDFETQKRFLSDLRNRYGDELELRLDANGAFPISDASQMLDQLNAFGIHSIEQPIKAGNWTDMASICSASPIPIALDEELIGVKSHNEKNELLDAIKPQFIILKPSLVGGLKECSQWIDLAESKGTGWWITSALESNIGLNAIAQYVFNKGAFMPQGLGTGSLFANNFDSPLSIQGEMLRFSAHSSWNLDELKDD